MEIGKNQEDRVLLNALRGGELQAYETLFRKYYPMLCAYAHRFVELEDAEEIVQEVMLWIWERREELVIDYSLSQYLFKMTYHRALNLITKKDIINRAETYFFSKKQEEMLEDINYYQLEELTKRIGEAVSSLPESYRTAFVMHRFKQMSYKEIGEALNVSPKTVAYRIQQSLKLLRIELKDYLPIAMLWLLGDLGN